MGVSLTEILKVVSHSSCILHGWQGLPEHLLSDLDIVVAPEDLPKLEANLLNLPNVQLVNLLQHESTCYYFVLAFREGKQLQFLPLDAAVDYRRNGRVWFSADELLIGRRRWKEFWVASPEVEFKYLLVKKVLKGAVPEHSAERLKELVEELGERAQELAMRLLGNQAGERAIRWVRTGDWEMFRRRIPELQKTLKRQKLRQDPLNSFRFWLPEIKRIWRRWRYPTGLFIVVLGPDGAGKSTLIGHLEADLLGAFRRTARFHLMPGLFRRKDNGGPVTNPHGKPPRSFFASLFKLGYYLLDYILGYWLKVRPALVKSTLVLFDRYYDDLLVDPRRYRYGGPVWLARFVARFIPKPDLFIFLDLPAEVAHTRKPEIPLEEARKLRERYLELARSLPNARVVDASRPLGEVVAEVESIILYHMAARTEQRIREMGLVG